MSAIAIKWVSEIKTGNQTAKQLLLFLASHSFYKPGFFFRLETIADQMEVSVRAVQKSIKLLEEKSYLSKEYRFDEKTGRQTTNGYYLNIPDSYYDVFFKEHEHISQGVNVVRKGGEGERSSSLGVNVVQGEGERSSGGGVKKDVNYSIQSISYEKSAFPNSNIKHNSNINNKEEVINNLSVKNKNNILVNLPAWLKKEEWEKFKQHRIELGKPLSALAEQTAIEEIDQLKNKGHDPIKVINQSIINGWAGLFELKSKTNQETQPIRNEVRSTVKEWGPGHPGWESLNGSRKKEVTNGQNGICAPTSNIRGGDMRQASGFLFQGHPLGRVLSRSSS